eukprot:6122265-Pyramimonas_sp.AAC.1
MKHRRRRLQAIKKAGADMRKLYKTGLDQANHYGGEVVGLTYSELAQSQTFYLSTVGPRRPTRSR